MFVSTVFKISYTLKFCQIFQISFVVSISMVWIIVLKLTIDFSCVLDDGRGRLQNRNYWIGDLQTDYCGEDGDVGSHWIFLKIIFVIKDFLLINFPIRIGNENCTIINSERSNRSVKVHRVQTKHEFDRTQISDHKRLF